VARRRGLLLLAGLVLVGVVVYLPSLRASYLLDDYLHSSMIDGNYPVHRGPLDLYDFIDDDERALFVDRGMLPWWSHPRIRIRFLRPLPSALRWGEQRLFGHATFPPHLHSFLWWIGAVLAALRLFRLLVPERQALLATLVFAFAPCHALPLAWLANREALISLTLGAFALGSYVRWRQRGEGKHGAIAAALFVASMTGGEYALSFGGFVLAFELIVQRDGAARRLVGLLSFALPAIAYLAVRAKLGYGTEGSGFYEDPLREPMAYVRVAPRRLAMLFSGEWLTLDLDTMEQSAPSWLLAVMVVGVFALVTVPFRRALAALPEPARARVRAMALGSLLALVPVLAVDPSPRVLGAAVLGLAPVIAIVLDCAWFPAEKLERRGVAELTGLVALALGFSHFVHGPMTAWTIAERYRRSSNDFVTHVEDLRRRVGGQPGELVVVRGYSSTFFVPFALDPSGKLPERWRVLATTGHVLGLRRDARTLELVSPKDQSLFTWHLFRDKAATVQPGEVFETPGLKVTILEVGPQGPRRARFELDRDLDDPGTAWIAETGRGEFPETTPPKAGFGQPYDP
jgi:hypothetical protein